MSVNSSPNPDSLAVLQWNVWYRAKAEKVAGHVLKIVEEHGAPDVLCLQELTEPAVQLVADAIEARDVSYIVTRRHKKGTLEGQAIMSRGLFANAANAEVVLLSQGGRAPLKGSDQSSRVLQKAKVITPSGLFMTVANVHMSYSTPTNAAIRHQELRGLRSSLADENNLLLTGDFNAVLKSQAIRALSTFMVRAEQDQPTWSSSQIDRVGLFRRNLDHVFTTPDVQISELSVLERGPSDHNPILVRAKPL